MTIQQQVTTSIQHGVTNHTVAAGTDCDAVNSLSQQRPVYDCLSVRHNSQIAPTAVICTVHSGVMTSRTHAYNSEPSLYPLQGQTADALTVGCRLISVSASGGGGGGDAHRSPSLAADEMDPDIQDAMLLSATSLRSSYGALNNMSALDISLALSSLSASDYRFYNSLTFPQRVRLPSASIITALQLLIMNQYTALCSCNRLSAGMYRVFTV